MCNTLYIHIWLHLKVRWSFQSPMVMPMFDGLSKKSDGMLPIQTPKSDGGEKKIVSSRHDCIIVYVVQEIKINKMAAEGYLTY